MSALADSVNAVVDNWPGAVATTALVVSGWVSLYLKQRGANNKVAEVGEQVTQVQKQVGKVQDQVANGHTTPLRTDLTEVLKRLDLATSFMEQLPNQQDIRGLREDITRVDAKLDNLEARVLRQYPKKPTT